MGCQEGSDYMMTAAWHRAGSNNNNYNNDNANLTGRVSLMQARAAGSSSVPVSLRDGLPCGCACAMT